MELTIVKDTQELERLEGIVDKCRDGINKLSVEGAHALRKIRDDKLYEKVRGEENFEKYCRERWDITRQTAYQMIDYVKVIENVSDCLQKPANERQARPLARLKPDQQLIAWQKVVDIAPEGKVTAAIVTKVVNEMTKKPPKVKTKISLGEEVTPAFKETCRLPCHDNRFRMTQGAGPPLVGRRDPEMALIARISREPRAR
jgi:hypothetical protein